MVNMFKYRFYLEASWFLRGFQNMSMRHFLYSKQIKMLCPICFERFFPGKSNGTAWYRGKVGLFAWGILWPSLFQAVILL
jgi:hypothetical protein